MHATSMPCNPTVQRRIVLALPPLTPCPMRRRIGNGGILLVQHKRKRKEREAWSRGNPEVTSRPLLAAPPPSPRPPTQNASSLSRSPTPLSCPPSLVAVRYTEKEEQRPLKATKLFPRRACFVPDCRSRTTGVLKNLLFLFAIRYWGYIEHESNKHNDKKITTTQR